MTCKSCGDHRSARKAAGQFGEALCHSCWVMLFRALLRRDPCPSRVYLQMSRDCVT